LAINLVITVFIKPFLEESAIASPNYTNANAIDIMLLITPPISPSAKDVVNSSQADPIVVMAE
jgi:hypothetical protein